MIKLYSGTFVFYALNGRRVSLGVFSHRTSWLYLVDEVADHSVPRAVGEPGSVFTVGHLQRTFITISSPVHEPKRLTNAPVCQTPEPSILGQHNRERGIGRNHKQHCHGVTSSAKQPIGARASRTRNASVEVTTVSCDTPGTLVEFETWSPDPDHIQN